MDDDRKKPIDLIKDYLVLKKKYQNLYFEHQEVLRKCENLEKENHDLKEKLNEECVLKENKRLVAKVSDMRRSTAIEITPRKPSFKLEKENNNDLEEFEVEHLLKHRGRKPNREFFVRWRNYSPGNDSWERENNLSCPKILKDYLKKHRLT